MDRYKNKGLENSLDQPNEGNRLSADHFHSGARKLHIYSRNLDDKKCALPPVPGDERARRAIATDNGVDGHFIGDRQGNSRSHQHGAWDQDLSNALRLEDAAPPADWKEERKRRVENAMRRVEQSYVGELRYGTNETTYVRPDCSESAEARKPYALVPIRARSVAAPSWEVGDTKGVAKEPKAEHIDRSLLIPSSKGKDAYRSPDEEYELDLKRQALLERKIREANEFHRKQKLNAFKPCKDDAKEKTKGHANTHHVPNPPSMQNRQIATHRYSETGGAPVPAPPVNARKEESYSKRKRKLKPCGAMNNDENVSVQYPSAPSEKRDAQREHLSVDVGTATRLSQVVPSTTREGRHGVSFEVDTKGFQCVSNCVRANVTDTGAESKPSGPKPPLIPRQASFNIWNGDTAKRGLGFKSKLRKEMEAASLRAVEPKEDVNPQRTQRPHVSSEVAAKWKREMFYNN